MCLIHERYYPSDGTFLTPNRPAHEINHTAPRMPVMAAASMLIYLSGK